MSYDDSDEGKQSGWNSAQLTNIRLDKLKNKIDQAWINPVAWNMEEQSFNYEVIFISNNLLLKAVIPKLSSAEEKEGEGLRKGIEEFIGKYPIVENKKKNYSKKGEDKLNEKNWFVLKKHLWNYCVNVGKYFDKHGMDIPNSESDEGL